LSGLSVGCHAQYIWFWEYASTVIAQWRSASEPPERRRLPAPATGLDHPQCDHGALWNRSPAEWIIELSPFYALGSCSTRRSIPPGGGHADVLRGRIDGATGV